MNKRRFSIKAIMLLLLILACNSCMNKHVFISNWDVSGETKEITLPLVNNGAYDFQVNWGDGSRDTITTWDSEAKTHSYKEEGIYSVKITGTLSGWAFGGPDSKYAESALQITEINQWGMLDLGETSRQFYGCRNLKISAQDIPDLSGVSSLENVFRDCLSIDKIPNIELWNTAHISNMSGMFRNAPLFDGDISGWNTENVVHISDMFLGAVSFSHSLSAWDLSKITNWDRGMENMEQLQNFWKSYDASKTFTSTWKIISSNQKITLPLVMNGVYHFIVDWGDGHQDEITGWQDEVKTHNYESNGTYELKITGIIEGWSFFENPGSAKSLSEISSWGALKWGDAKWPFYRCSNLVITAEDKPDLSATTSLAYAFYGCSSLSFFESINDWDTSGIESVEALFLKSSFPAERITGWDNSSIPDIDYMAQESEHFSKKNLTAYPIDNSKWALGWSTYGTFCYITRTYSQSFIIIQNLITDTYLVYDYVDDKSGLIIRQDDRNLNIELNNKYVQDLLIAHNIIPLNQAPDVNRRRPFPYGNSNYSFFYETETTEVPLYGGSFAPPGFDPHDPDFKPEPVDYRTKITHTEIYIKRTQEGSGKVTQKMIYSSPGNYEISSIVFSPYEPRVAVLIQEIPFIDEYDLRGGDVDDIRQFFIGKHLYAGLQ